MSPKTKDEWSCLQMRIRDASNLSRVKAGLKSRQQEKTRPHILAQSVLPDDETLKEAAL